MPLRIFNTHNQLFKNILRNQLLVHLDLYIFTHAKKNSIYNYSL
jgi:hypothetical protein